MLIAPVVAFFEHITAGIPLVSVLYSRQYDPIVDAEIALGSIFATDTVLNIGCGAIPFTAIQIARKTGARIKAVDCNIKAVVAARRCVAALGLSDRISVYLAEGQKWNDSDFSVALIALQARPKKEILDRLAQLSTLDTRLLARRPRRHLFREYDMLPDNLKPQALVHQNMKTFDATVLYSSNMVQIAGGFSPCADSLSVAVCGAGA